MSAASLPLSQLQQHVTSGRSGEFICATSMVEVHVFLQRGRIAWATDAAHPFEFAKELKSRQNIDDLTFREVIEACRRDRLPLGETLVAWDLASWGDVQAALAHQLRLALHSLARCPSGSTVFLERRNFSEYNERLTFELAELVGELADDADFAAAEAPTNPHAGSTARQLLEIIKGARWVQLLEEGRLVDAAGGTRDAGVRPDFACVTLGDGADFIAVRSADGCLLGAVLAGSRRQMWSMLAVDSTFGAAIATLSAAGILSTRRRREHAPGVATWRRSASCQMYESSLEQVFAFGRDVLGVAILSHDDEVVCGIGRAGLDEQQCVDLARRRARTFVELGRMKQGALGSLGFDLRTMVTGEDSVWCFGAEMFGARAGSTLWVFTRRDGSQGVGWACLTALSRSLSKNDEGQP